MRSLNSGGFILALVGALLMFASVQAWAGGGSPLAIGEAVMVSADVDAMQVSAVNYERSFIGVTMEVSTPNFIGLDFIGITCNCGKCASSISYEMVVAFYAPPSMGFDNDAFYADIQPMISGEASTMAPKGVGPPAYSLLCQLLTTWDSKS